MKVTEALYFLSFILIHSSHTTNAQDVCPVLNIPDCPCRRVGNGGDPHILTWDDVFYDCQGVGEFITVTSLSDPGFMVQERFTSVSSSFHASVSTGLVLTDVGVPTVEISIPRDDSSGALNTMNGCPIDLYFDGTATTYDADFGPEVEVCIDENRGLIRVTHTTSGLMFQALVLESTAFGCYFIFQGLIPEDYRPGEVLYGLQGTPNCDATDDWTVRSGVAIPIPATEEDRMFQPAYDYCTNNWCISDPTESIFTYGRAGESHASFYACDEPYDGALEALVANPSVELRNLCGTNLRCILDGTVGSLEDARIWNRMERIIGACPDPHIWTWKGTMYDYHGACDLVYTSCPNFDNGKGLRIHLRTKFVLPRKWSTIDSIAVKLGNDVFELQENGNYYLNGVLKPDLTRATMAGRALIYHGREIKGINMQVFTIMLQDGLTLTLVGAKQIHFKIRGIDEYRKNGGTLFSDCVGLSSTWDHPEGAEFLVGRSGTTYSEEDVIDFGPEWQVDFTKDDPLLFVENVGQQLPDQKCTDSPLQARDQRHLKALLEAEGGKLAREAEEACSHVQGDDLADACFFDVLVTGDASFAQEPWYTGFEY